VARDEAIALQMSNLPSHIVVHSATSRLEAGVAISISSVAASHGLAINPTLVDFIGWTSVKGPIILLSQDYWPCYTGLCQ